MTSFGKPKIETLNGIQRASFKDFLLCAIGKKACYKVVGGSMSPHLFTGDRVIVQPTSTVEVSDIVVAYDPDRLLNVVKVVAEIGNHITLKGTNAENSSDSIVKKHNIIGKVTAFAKK